MVAKLWEEVKLMPKETLHKEVVDWVLDPGTIAVRASSYECMLMIY